MPRLIDDLAETLRWNEEALRRTPAVGDRRVRGFLASLYAWVGQCRVQLGDLTGGRDALRTAMTHLADVPEGAYKAGLIAMIEAEVVSGTDG